MDEHMIGGGGDPMVARVGRRWRSKTGSERRAKDWVDRTDVDCQLNAGPNIAMTFDSIKTISNR